MAALFEASMPHIRKWEGYYSSISKDRGGETYAGISRKNHPNWAGWPLIDREKLQKGGKLPWNYKIEDYNLELHINAFYRNYWNQSRAGELKTQELADLYFDLAVNSGVGRAAQLLQMAIVRLGVPVAIDKAIGPQTLAAVKKLDPVLLYQALKEERKGYYERLVQKDPTQADFLQGWLRRLASFPDLKKKASLMVLALTVGSAIMVYKYITE